MAKKNKPDNSNSIAVNKKARFEYFIEEKFEAGLVLEGWEVKSLRDKKINLEESYIQLKNGEAWLVGALIQALPTASTHISPEPLRSRKLLLHQNELGRIFDGVNKDGHTCIPLGMHWHKGRAKCNIALARGKHKYDKRATEKDRDWGRQKQRIMRHD